MKNVYVAGSVAYDDIMDFPHHFKDYFHPKKLHRINISFVVNNLAKHLGGIATNISYALKNTADYYSVISLKTSHPEFTLPLFHPSDYGGARQVQHDKVVIYPVATVGKDGDDLLTFFKKNHINTSFVGKDEKLYTSTGKVITDMKNNQIWGFYYGAAKLNIDIHILKHNQKGNEDFWIISATHKNPFTKTLCYVIKNKLPYLFDPGMVLTWIDDDTLRKGVLHAAYVVGNDYEIGMIEKRLQMSVKEIVEKGVNVIVTLGEKGVKYVGSDSGILTVKAVKLKKIVDPTGAGDAWRGGFVGALAAGKSLNECLIMGNVMASFAVESVGTVEYKTIKEEIDKRIQTLMKKGSK